MATSTAETIHQLIDSQMKRGKTQEEALSEICSVVDDMMAMPGIVKGLQDMEAGRITPLNKKFSDGLKSRILKKMKA
jgi:hypothetical protein